MLIALFDAAATTRDGKPYKNTSSWYMRMRDDQIVEVTAFFDSMEFNDFWARYSCDVSARLGLMFPLGETTMSALGQSRKCSG